MTNIAFALSTGGLTRGTANAYAAAAQGARHHRA